MLDAVTIIASVFSILTGIVTGVIGYRAYLRNRRVKQLKRFHHDVQSLMEMIADNSGHKFTTQRTQDLVKKLISTISAIHFGSSDLPRVMHDSQLEHPPGTKVNCFVCRKKNIVIEPNGCCSHCGLHSILWWGATKDA